MQFFGFTFLRSKIGVALIVPYLVTSVLILFLVGGIIYYNYTTRIASIEELQVEISRTTATGIDDYVSSISKELELTQENINCSNCIDPRDTLTLEHTLQSDPSLYEISILTLKGKEIHSVIKYEQQGSTTIASSFDIASLTTALSTRHFYVSKPYLSPYGLPSVSISVPILAQNGQYIGILSAAVDLSPMWERVSKINFKHSGYAYVVDTAGHLIAYRNEPLVAQNINLSSSTGVKNFLKEAYGFQTYTSFTGKSVIGNSRPVTTTGWGVIVELPTSEVLNELLVLFIIAAISALLLSISLLLPLRIIFREILGPVSSLHRGVRELQKGHLDYTVKVESKTELGELGVSFNEMAARLSEIDRAKSEFISLASHQLRTPATSISWYSEMLLGEEVGSLNKLQKEYMEEIHHGNERMITLINSLLNVSRIELGTYTVEPKSVAVDQVAEDVLKELQIQIAKKQLHIIKNYSTDSVIVSDPVLVRIIFQNLLSNAVAYTPEHGTISVSVAKDDTWVNIAVKDSGCGIPAADQSKIFTRFYRADNARNVRPDGSGLGLYITKSIVGVLGGEIRFESKENSGTTFFVTIQKHVEAEKKIGKRTV